MNHMLQQAYDAGFVEGLLLGGGGVLAGVLAGWAVVWLVKRGRSV